MPIVETRTILAPDGRSLMVELGGNPTGPPILVHNGTPNSRHLYRSWLEDAAQQGIRLISYDRPGYGGSTAQPGRTVADCAADVRAIAAALGLPRLAVWGASGGGPHALACAALLPDLVVAVSVLGSVAPYDARGLDYFSGMGQDNVDDIQLYLADPAAARRKSQQDRFDGLGRSPDQLGEALKTLLSPVDASVLADDFAAWLVRCFTDGLATSEEGWWEDGAAHLSPWGFDLGTIRIPVQVWHGRHDRFVPYQHGAWLAERVQGCEAHLSDSDGHLTLLVNRIPDVHRWLARQLGFGTA
ncbi:MAG: alpha/beta fold hydrolase [Candidatus Limnocylindrales bacterium]